MTLVWARNIRPFMRALPVLILLLLAACYRVDERGAETTITFNGTVHVFAVVFPLLAIYGAYRFLSKPRGRVYAVVCLVFALGLSFATWSVFSARIVMTATEIYDWRGWPWERTKRGFVFADVARVDTTVEYRGYGRSSQRLPVWNLQLRNGGAARLEPGDLWEHAEREIFQHLERHGIACGIDPKALGLASDDPAVATVDKNEYRLDASSAKERLAGLVHGGHVGRMLADDDKLELQAAKRAGRSLIGEWHRRVGQGSRAVDLRLRFEPTGSFVLEVSSGGRTQRSKGTYRTKGSALTLVQDGESFEMLF